MAIPASSLPHPCTKVCQAHLGEGVDAVDDGLGVAHTLLIEVWRPEGVRLAHTKALQAQRERQYGDGNRGEGGDAGGKE